MATINGPLTSTARSRGVPGRQHRAGLGLALAVASVLVAASCSSPVTEQEFVDHALKISTTATSDKDRARLEEVFRCTWDAMQGDEELVDAFMATDKPDPEMSATVSKKMLPCVTAASKTKQP